MVYACVLVWLWVEANNGEISLTPLIEARLLPSNRMEETDLLFIMEMQALRLRSDLENATEH